MRMVLDFPCPTCGADPGGHCRTSSGRVRSLPHDDRSWTAIEWNRKHDADATSRAKKGNNDS